MELFDWAVHIQVFNIEIVLINFNANSKIFRMSTVVRVFRVMMPLLEKMSMPEHNCKDTILWNFICGQEWFYIFLFDYLYKIYLICLRPKKNATFSLVSELVTGEPLCCVMFEYKKKYINDTLTINLYMDASEKPPFKSYIWDVFPGWTVSITSLMTYLGLTQFYQSW